jgi:hypothetical protein
MRYKRIGIIYMFAYYSAKRLLNNLVCHPRRIQLLPLTLTPIFILNYDQTGEIKVI